VSVNFLTNEFWDPVLSMNHYVPKPVCVYAPLQEVLSDDDDDDPSNSRNDGSITSVTELVAAFVDGDNVLDALGRASIQCLCDFLPTFVSGLVATPMFLMDYRRKSVAFLSSVCCISCSLK